MRFMNVQIIRFDECQVKDEKKKITKDEQIEKYMNEKEKRDLDGRPERIEEQKTRYIDYFIYCPIKRIA